MHAHNEEMRSCYERIDAETRAAAASTPPEPTAPNAANAAPLMPVCDACHGTGISGNERTYDINTGTYTETDTPVHCYTCDGTGRLRATREGFPPIIRPGHLGADESLPAYAWPGGYPLAYYPCTYRAAEHAEMIGDVLCPDCATAELHADEPDESLCFISQIEEEVSESNLTCDNCNAVIAYQTYCHDCRESVDCDDDHPFHLCPATEPYTVRFLTHCPGSDWITWEGAYPVEGPDHARSIATALRNTGNAAFVHVQPSRLDFPPVISEEEE
jgi:hypothetical protein